MQNVRIHPRKYGALFLVHLLHKLLLTFITSLTGGHGMCVKTSRLCLDLYELYYISPNLLLILLQADNGNGNANEYDVKSFKEMLKRTKAAIDEGFDIGILPEGQPNPTPEKGMQPIFSGAYTLARMSRRPIKMIALYGLNRMWHPAGDMPCISRNMSVRVYPNGRVYKDAEEFSSTFSTVAGYFGAHGKDMPQEELNMWLDGSMWQTELSRREATRMAAEDIEDEETRYDGVKFEPRNETKSQSTQ